MKGEAVGRLLRSYGMEPHELHEVEKVVQEGKRTFAILLAIGRGNEIRTFVERERYTQSNLDAKLPISLPVLRDYIGPVGADDFDLRQWEFIAPIFRGTHSYMAAETILPFTLEERLNKEKEGSFGAIYKVKLPRSHVEALATTREEEPILIRKDIGILSTGHTLETLNINFREELKMLACLSALKHPSILPLFGSYTLNKTHSFLFPKKDCNLAEILAGKLNNIIFRNDRSTFHALSHLSSAIESLHNFTSDRFQVELIGCHRDIKPDNILVDSQGLYLADFGLSVFREAKDGSSTSYNHGGGYYRAPECEIPSNRFQKGKINRASDIWSFGCILAEVLTYLCKGPEGVVAFKQERRIELYGGLTTFVFHNRDEEHPRVKPWLKQLPMGTENAREGLLSLVLATLNIEHGERPSATKLTLALRRLSLQCRLKEVSAKLKAFRGRKDLTDIDIELERMMLIQASIDDVQTNSTFVDLRRALDAKLSTASSVDDVLRDFDEVEAGVEEQDRQNVYAQDIELLSYRLFGAVDRLLNVVPDHVKADLQSRLEIQFLSTEDRETLERYRDAFNGSAENRLFSRLAAAKLMNLSYSSTNLQQFGKLQYDSSMIGSLEEFDGICTANFEACRVIVENKKILSSQSEHGERILQRVQGLAEELAKPPIPDSNTLQCVGFCINLKETSFSLLFKFPVINDDDAYSQWTVPRTLSGILIAKAKKPMLEHRFQLALGLARSIAQLHKAAWLHKNLHSGSVVFFQSQYKSSTTEDSITKPDIDFRQPFVVGFNHSRPGDVNEWSEGLSADTSLLDYHHPDYACGKEGYLLAYDYYSLGLVLLEVGLWKTLSMLKAKKKGMRPHKLSRRIIEDLVPELGAQMGSVYAAVVRFCLDEIQKEPEEPGTSDIHTAHVQLMFNERVVKRLQACTLVLAGPDDSHL
ncbi:unnamed protein product [Alternaria alternata]